MSRRWVANCGPDGARRAGPRKPRGGQIGETRTIDAGPPDPVTTEDAARRQGAGNDADGSHIKIVSQPVLHPAVKIPQHQHVGVVINIVGADGQLSDRVSFGNGFVAFFGDGSLGMSVGEFETIVRLGAPVIFLNFNNESF